MKSYIVTLTDEAQSQPERFLPQIEAALSALGCGNFQYMPTVGVISVDFPSEVIIGPISGVEAFEESVEAHTQAKDFAPGGIFDGHPLAVQNENGKAVGVFGKW